MDASLVKEVWTRLIDGASLESLNLPRIDGRIDLRNLVAPQPSLVREYATPLAQISEFDNIIEIRGVRWKGIDFSRTLLDSLRFFDVVIEDCCFDGARCRDWRLWSSEISNTTFRRTDLRESALGGIGVDGESRNALRNVNFTNADLRRTAYTSADFVDCLFSNSNLKKVDFQGSIFTDCRFEGELDEVMFYRHGFGGKQFPPNEMARVDFSRAQLRWCEFRGLDLTQIRFPDDEDHIVIDDYPETLSRLLRVLTSRPDSISKQVAAVLGSNLKWAGAKQTRGILNKRDLLDIGEEALTSVVALLASTDG